MREHDVLKKNKNFYIGVGGTVLEGLLSGSLFLLLYSVMQFLWAGQFDLNRVLMLTGAIAGIFLLRSGLCEAPEQGPASWLFMRTNRLLL